MRQQKTRLHKRNRKYIRETLPKSYRTIDTETLEKLEDDFPQIEQTENKMQLLKKHMIRH